MTFVEKTHFGELSGELLGAGDIVEWTVWDSLEEAWVGHYGVITEINNKIISNRLVTMATVIPVDRSKPEMEFFTLSLKLISRGASGGPQKNG